MHIQVSGVRVAIALIMALSSARALAQLPSGPIFGPPPADIAALPTDDLIPLLSLSRDPDAQGRSKFTWADAEFVRRLDVNAVTWSQLARAVEHMQIMRTSPRWSPGQPVFVWMRLPEWWKSIALRADPSLPGVAALTCTTARSPSCSVPSPDEIQESAQSLGAFPPGFHEVRFSATFRSVHWQADAREDWSVIFTLRFEVAPRPCWEPIQTQASHDEIREAIRFDADPDRIGNRQTLSISASQLHRRDPSPYVIETRAELLRDGVVIDRRQVRWSDNPADRRRWTVLAQHRLAPDETLDPRWFDRYTVRVVGLLPEDSGLWACDRYWAGTLDMPLAGLLVPPQ